jgi:hypothetical protein
MDINLQLPEKIGAWCPNENAPFSVHRMLTGSSLATPSWLGEDARDRKATRVQLTAPA